MSTSNNKKRNEDAFSSVKVEKILHVDFISDDSNVVKAAIAQKTVLHLFDMVLARTLWQP